MPAPTVAKSSHSLPNKVRTREVFVALPPWLHFWSIAFMSSSSCGYRSQKLIMSRQIRPTVKIGFEDIQREKCTERGGDEDKTFLKVVCSKTKQKNVYRTIRAHTCALLCYSCIRCCLHCPNMCVLASVFR